MQPPSVGKAEEFLQFFNQANPRSASYSANMYVMKPLSTNVETLNINSPMYRMKNLHGDSCPTQCPMSEEEMTTIENEQARILEGLSQLNALIDQIRKSILEEKPRAQKAHAQKASFGTCRSPSEFPCVHDIVVNANPSSPPFSLLALQKAWSSLVDVNISCHVHSSAKGAPQGWPGSLDTKTEGSAQQINVRLVWKEISGDCELIVSPIKAVPLLGEVNLLRLLKRWHFSEGDPLVEVKVDDALDQIHRLSVKGDAGEDVTNSLLRLLSASKHWIVGDSPSIADIAAWSLIKRKNVTFPPNSPASQWLSKSNQLFSGSSA